MLTYVTIPFQVAEITDDPLLVGLIGVCELVPLLVMAFVGGALADYLDRRLLVLGGEVAQMVLTGVLLANALLRPADRVAAVRDRGTERRRSTACSGRPWRASSRASSRRTRSRPPARSDRCGCRSPGSADRPRPAY